MTLTRREFLRYSAIVSLALLPGGRLISYTARTASPREPAGEPRGRLRGAIGAGVWWEPCSEKYRAGDGRA